MTGIEPGDKIYVTKNDSSIYAMVIGTEPLADAGFHIICAHCDSPTFRIKPNAEMLRQGMLSLNTEVYGGPIMSTWFDRPLSLAGRVILSTDDVMAPETRLLHIKRPLLTIPNLAIHFNRQVNDGVKLSRQKDMLPLMAIVKGEMERDGVLLSLIASELGVGKERILDFDAFVDIRNIVGKRTIQYYQFNVKGIDNIVNGNGHIFYKKFCHMKCFRFLFLVFPEKGINGNVCSSG